MSYSQIRYVVEEGIATVTLDRPDRLNAWTAVMETEMRAVMAEIAADDKVRVAILTGAGRGFCAGADMERLTQASEDASRLRPASDVVPGPADALPDFRRRYSYFPMVPKPVLAAINGPAAGIGLVLALYCDLRFMSEDAILTTAFSRRGLVAEHGVDWLLTRLVGPSVALDLLLSSRKLDAAEALRLGLVNRTAPAGGALAAARDYAVELRDWVSPRSMAVIKRQTWEAPLRSLGEAVANGETEMQKAFASADFREGIASYRERRKPAFEGR